MSDFNPQDLLESTIDSALDVQRVKIPEGIWDAVINKVEVSNGLAKKDGKPWFRLDVTWEIINPEVAEITGQDRVLSTQGVMLEVENGALAVGAGKNIGLGRLRQATGLNQAGVAFQLIHLQGQSARVVCKHNPSKDDPSKVYVNLDVCYEG